MRTDYKHVSQKSLTKSAKKQQILWVSLIFVIAIASFGLILLFLDGSSSEPIVTSSKGSENIQVETIASPRPISPNANANRIKNIDNTMNYTAEEARAIATLEAKNTGNSDVEEDEAFDPFPNLFDALLIPGPMPDKAATHPEWSGAEWKMVKVEKGDTAAQIFQKLGLSSKDLANILALGFSTKALQTLQPGQVLRFFVTKDNEILELIYNMNTSKSLVVTRENDSYVAEVETRPLSEKNKYASATIDTTLAAAADEAGISGKLLNQLAGIYGWDIDFSRDLRPGDKFELVYQEFYDDGKKVATGNILAARFVNKGETYGAIRFVEPDGSVGYYRPNGKSLQRSFLRAPVKNARISSRFSLARKHPVLHKIRAHKGVDYAAPTGTAIRATSDGVIAYVGWRGGYGRTVMVKHDNTYTTLYAHMSRFNKKLKKGSKIKQGQVIGYIGSSGLATGPHLHYELRKNNKQIDPLGNKLPQTASIEKKYFDEFQQEAQEMLVLLNANNDNVQLAAAGNMSPL